MKRAAFLDRDGVINVDRGYVHRREDFVLLPGVVDALHALQDAGYTLIVTTNQSGIARGLFSESDYLALTDWMCARFAAQHVRLAGVYHCPHHPSGKVLPFARDCLCRKPAPGLLLRAAQDLSLDLGASFMVGDKPSDIEAGRRAGVGHCYGVRSDNPESAGLAALADASYDSLADCVADLLRPTA